MLIDEAKNLQKLISDFHISPVNESFSIQYKSQEGISIAGPGSNIYYIFKKYLPIIKTEYYLVMCCDEDGFFKINNSFSFKKSLVIVFNELILDLE